MADSDGFPLASDSIPLRVKHAQIEAALRAEDELMPDIDEPGEIASESVSVGNGAVSQSVTYVGGKSQIARLRKIDVLLREFLKTATVERG
jgi:hypothetical protein